MGSMARLCKAEEANDTVRRLEKEINEYLAWAANPAVSKMAINMLGEVLQTVISQSERSVAHESDTLTGMAVRHPLKVEVA